MSLQARRELILRIRERYQQADKPGKTEILNGFIHATGYGRKHAITVLGGARPIPEQVKTPARNRLPKYDSEVQQVLSAVWNAANQVCSKRLVPFLPEFVESLERFGHLSISAETKKKLLKMSPATVDRVLRSERSQLPRGKSTTKAGSLLKSKIKVRTFADWNDASPGFFEADLVAHCGDSAEGSFLNSFVLTDVATGWTEFVPLLRKGEADVIDSLDVLRSFMPIPLLGLDTDNGSEFINYALLEFCEQNKITFTRSRAYKKNDQAHVEQKNGNIIRRMVGFDRFDGDEAANAMLALYQVLRLYVNFFQPSLKLVSKSRVGSKTVKAYDRAQTPYQRLLASKHVSKHKKESLKRQYQELDPMLLFREIGHRQSKLWKHSWVPEVKNVGTEQAPVPVPVIAKPKPPVEPAQMFLKTLKESAPKRQYKHSGKQRVPCTWRTRTDPFAEANEDMELLLRLDPKQTSRQLFTELTKRFPGKFDDSHYRTLQRRLKSWRKAFAPNPLKMSIYTDQTVQSELDQLIQRALEQHPNFKHHGSNINESTSLS
ncbi:MAG: ISNCY family transposase [Candidatus Obscuribacterales bacterium]|nr:ISNCY family transposase [Candidatus Obscuribacterales bacterium]